RKIINQLEKYAQRNPQRVLAIPSLGQHRYLSAIKHAAALIGNSSSGIIEAPAFHVPTVNIGERQRGRIAAKSVLHSPVITENIVQTIHQALNHTYKTADEIIINPYGQGDASAKILTMIKSTQFSSQKTFYDLK
ncbi:UDP-N-acetylglucosamine 2-epimerase, partial [Escherichia coli]